MQIIYAREPLVLNEYGSIALAGPTPRSAFPSWRPEALRILKLREFKGVVLVPEDRSGVFQCQYDYQVSWEEEMLQRSTCICFWWAVKFPEMPALVSRDEFGTWKHSGKVVAGFPPWAEKVKYQKYYAEKLRIPTAETLEETLDLAISMAYVLRENNDVERVPAEGSKR